MEGAGLSDAVSSLLSRSLDDIIADSRSAAKKAPSGKAKGKAPRAQAAPFVKREAAPSDASTVRVKNLAWTGERRLLKMAPASRPETRPICVCYYLLSHARRS